MMRLRTYLAVLAACLAAGAEGSGSVNALVAEVRADLQRNLSDSRVARDVRKVQLRERLDDRTVETLESEGAGEETVAELLILRDRSARLPNPLTPAIPEPAAPSPAEQAEIWNAAHNNAVNYTESLPDFICNEVIQRYSNVNRKASWKLADTLVLKLSYFEHREEYKLMTVNNRSTGLSYEDMQGAITEGEFGSMLAAMFAPKSRTNRAWDHWTLLRNRSTHVYTFAIAAANSDYRIASGTTRGEHSVTVGQHGFLYIDSSTKRVVRLAAVADEFPRDFDVRRVNLVLDYAFTDVGGTHYLLPLHAQTTILVPPYQRRNETDFLQYRKFSADTTITYDGTVKK
jgi:hypothetical protein